MSEHLPPPMHCVWARINAEETERQQLKKGAQLDTIRSPYVMNNKGETSPQED